MGNYYSTPEMSLETISKSFVEEIDRDNKNNNYTYLIDYNGELFYSSNSNTIIKFINYVRKKYIIDVIENNTVYKTRIYEQINSTICEYLATEQQLKQMFENDIEINEIYKLDITESFRTTIISYETTVSKLRITRVPDLEEFTKEIDIDDQDNDNDNDEDDIDEDKQNLENVEKEE